jgi:gluconolactonase
MVAAMAELREVATGLGFPEGPVAMSDGSVIVVEIAHGTVTRVGKDGSKEEIARPGGGPNGAAVGPDGNLYVCNNGAAFDYLEMEGMEGIRVPRQPPSNYSHGRIERIDLASGAVEVVYKECEGRPLRAPNDLVFDGHGGFYFTDHGIREHRTADRTGVFYAQADGSSVREVIPPLDAPNGVGLSPDGSRLYVAETYTACIWYWDIAGPGDVTVPQGLLPHGGELLTRLPGFQFLDSLAVDGEGNVCVATLGSGGITTVSPEDGSVVEFVEGGDLFVTNICFGGEDLRTAYLTLSGAGKLAEVPWARAGLALAHAA